MIVAMLFCHDDGVEDAAELNVINQGKEQLGKSNTWRFNLSKIWCR